MSKDLELFAKNIKKLRKKRKMTLEQLALKVEVSPNHISKLEAANTNPSFPLISKLASALKVEIKELFDFDEFRDENYFKNEFRKIINLSNEKNLKMLYKIYNDIF